MKTDRVMLFAGGDTRMCFAAETLSALPGWRIESILPARPFDIPEIHTCADPVQIQTLLPWDVLVLPVPASKDGASVFVAPPHPPLSLDTLLSAGKPGAWVLGGACCPAVSEKIRAAGLSFVDYCQDESLALANAVPTAEGAIQIAMEEMDTTLQGGRAVIIGFGRIGMALAPRLRALGMDVTICARRRDMCAQAQMLGFRAALLPQLADLCAAADLVVNTAPALVMGAAALSRLPQHALVIDLASKPGGVDFSAAKRLGRQTVWALALPPAGWA